jgi:hypothetical protein
METIPAQNKTLAILGGPHYAKKLLEQYSPYVPGEIDVWWLNKMHELSWWDEIEPFITMYWDIHPFFRMERRREWNHLNWLLETYEERTYTGPIMMRRKYERVPKSIGYPIRAVAEQVPGADVRTLFGCTHSMMMGYAILRGYERIECYGVNLMNPVETYLEKPSWALWYGVALAKGIEVDLTHSPYLLPTVTYFNDRLGQIQDQFTPAVVAYQAWGTEQTGYHDEFAMTHSDWEKLWEAQGG